MSKSTELRRCIATTTMALSENDPSSFSCPSDCTIKSLDLRLAVDFTSHILSGCVTIVALKKEESCKHLLLDTRDLNIKKITSDDTALSFTVGKPVLSFGSKLEIVLPQSDDKEVTLDIEYETSDKSTALQWLSEEQTAGKKHPYLFSQCQAIHARSLLPCQDTPSVKMPYTAELTIPAELVGLMSAVKKETLKHPTDESKLINKFEQKIPIPSYLIALVVGPLESRDIGPRSKVWSEASMVDKAAYEFAETEKMLSTAEELLGPYVWGVYDLLVLPPSFPYGGMENPCLTFVTPTLLAGDRSLATVVAHEISHSWTGNLVTNKNPEHFWLNEGHTVFVERKIAARMRGEQSRHFEALGGWKDLQYQVDVFGAEHPYTHLVPDLTGVDPDDAFSSVPYEKGSSLLMYLEQLLGGPEIFEGFLKGYIERFKYKSITTDDWKEYLYEYFKDKKSTLDEVDWKTWFHSPGMPPVKPKLDTSLSDAIAKLCQEWTKSSEDNLKQFTADDLKTLSSAQVRELLAHLLEEKPLSEEKISRMEEIYQFNSVQNSEIKFRWLRLQLRAHIKSAISKALEFVNEQGRLKFVRPIYRDLYQWEDSKNQAIDNYKENSKSMHVLTATMIGKDLKVIT